MQSDFVVQSKAFWADSIENANVTEQENRFALFCASQLKPKALYMLIHAPANDSLYKTLDHMIRLSLIAMVGFFASMPRFVG
jgi:hypothetical protein